MREKFDLYGYAGKILRLNLSDRKIWSESTAKYAKQWLGASGIAIKILYDEVKPWVTPYEPANKLVFGAGPLIGTTAPGANKMNLSTVGPMTGGWATSSSDSYVGGQIKCAGYDSIVIEGRSSKPVYLLILDGKIEIRDAAHLWGKTTWETLDLIRKELRDPELHIVSIGPAGENLVRGACVIQDTGRAFGRCGQGAVMGSKNLKAIVAKGTGAVRIAEPEAFMAAVQKSRKIFKNSDKVSIFHRYGTLSSIDNKQKTCGVCYKNFQETRMPDDMAAVCNPMKMADKYSISSVSFPGCGVGGCGRRLHITEGPYAGLISECNQWEVVGTLQGRLAIWEPTFMVKANALCNQLGLDVDMAGGSIGWAMECFQRGILNETDTDGLKLCWGDAEVALEMIRKISYREGFGNILAEGCARAADLIGQDSAYYAMNIKGQDLYEVCRGANAWALAAVTSTRGGGHTTGGVFCETDSGLNVAKAQEIYGVDNPNKPLDYEGKAKMVYYMETVHRVCNSLGVCIFNTVTKNVDWVGLRQLAELYSFATGRTTSEADLKRLTMKQLNLEKAFNLRRTSFDRKDDMPTQRDLNEPVPTGSLAGWKIDLEKWNKMLDEYYDLHGWERKTSFPTRRALVEVDLEDVAVDLEKIGKLGKDDPNDMDI